MKPLLLRPSTALGEKETHGRLFWFTLEDEINTVMTTFILLLSLRKKIHLPAGLIHPPGNKTKFRKLNYVRINVIQQGLDFFSAGSEECK